MSKRWRPTLAFVLGGALFGTLCLSFVGLVLLRYIGPEIGFQNAAILLALCIAALTSALGWLLVRLLLRPIQGLEAFAAAHEDGAGSATLTHYGTKEIHHTATRVVRMAEALRDREASIRSYTDHVTHELKTPVSVIRAATELLADSPPEDGQNRLLVDQIAEAGRTIEKQLDSLRDAARARETRYVGTCHLGALEPALARAHPEMALNYKGSLVAFPIAAEGLLIVLHQILRNAAEHGARAVTLTASEVGGATLTVANDGAPIDPGDVDQVFTAFYTTRRDTGGTGMGLSIARNALEANGGQIGVCATETGAAFEISFPAG